MYLNLSALPYTHVYLTVIVTDYRQILILLTKHDMIIF